MSLQKNAVPQTGLAGRDSALAGLSLLYVEDDPIIRDTLARILGRRVGRLLLAADGAEGLALFERERPQLVLTDILMPVMNGLDMIERIRTHSKTTPIVITTAFNETEHIRRALDLGVDKYVTKPVDVRALIGALEGCARQVLLEQAHGLANAVFENSPVAILVTDSDNRILSVNPAFTEITGYRAEDVLQRSPSLLASGRHGPAYYAQMWQSLAETGKWNGEIWNRRANGEVYPEWLSLSVVHDEQGMVLHHVAIFSDITERKRSEARILHLAHHDALTGLPNRTLLNDRLHQAMLQAGRSGERVAVIFIDLDRFKNINDSLGHHVGDELLRQVAERLVACVRQEDTVCRQGGDEFVMLLPRLGERGDAACVAQKVLAALNQEFPVEGHALRISASIGISFYPDDGDTPEVLMQRADSAMYRAKDLGRDNYQFHLDDGTSPKLEHLLLETALRGAVERGELRLAFQPLIDAHTGSISGAEALVRWQHAERGVIPPAEFIPLAEDSGVIVAVGEWVLRAACHEAAGWPRGSNGPLQLAVNLSVRQVRHPTFVDTVSAILEESGLPPERLELEVTESLLMAGTEAAVAALAELRRMGVRIAIDDFGTGYSSLSYLRHLPIDTLKIDRSFVDGILRSETDAAIVETIVTLAHNLGLTVVAEGVEAEEQRAFLVHDGCDRLQGFYFSKPLPAVDFRQLLGVSRPV